MAALDVSSLLIDFKMNQILRRRFNAGGHQVVVEVVKLLGLYQVVCYMCVGWKLMVGDVTLPSITRTLPCCWNNEMESGTAIGNTQLLLCVCAKERETMHECVDNPTPVFDWCLSPPPQ